MKLGSLSAILGLAFLSASLLFIHSSASYSAGTPASPVAPSGGQIVIPAASLPPFDPAATRIRESGGTLIIHLETGDSRQDLHILPPSADQRVSAVHVFHANHGQLMTLRLDDGCRSASEPAQSTSRPLTEAEQARESRSACGRYAA